MTRAAVAIFAKAPVPGRVKTRLTPPLTPDEAARVARASLLATLRRFVPAAEATFALFLEGTADHTIRALAAGLGVGIFPQSEGDLGSRLRAAFGFLRMRGADVTVALGSDSPTLDPLRLSEAIEALQRHDLVIGPAEDGGYYLIGMRGDHGAVFEGIPWSTPEVTPSTLDRAERLELSTCVLPEWYDVDDPATLLRAVEDSKEMGLSLGLDLEELRRRLAPWVDSPEA
jgi:rSAM/selenodomain-associated transferase 1